MLQRLSKTVQQWLKGTTLLPYSVVNELNPLGEHYIGVRTIDLHHVIGSVNRHQDFDQDFRLKAKHLEERWAKMQQLFRSGASLPPIQVIKVGEAYFVKDGNHRVSVAKHEGQVFLEAEIVEVVVERELELNSERNARQPSKRAKQPVRATGMLSNELTAITAK